MNKGSIFAVLVAFTMMSASAYAGFDKNPTSALHDRRATAEENKEQTKLLKKLLQETVKTNEILERLIEEQSNSGRTKQQEPSPEGDNDSSEEGVDNEPVGGRRRRR